jgi:Bacterial Ig domain/Calx-beta domain
MKTMRCVWRPFSEGRLLVLLTLGLALPGLAQIGYPWPSPPTVTIEATDPYATWSGDPGQFTVFRHGDTNAMLMLFCRISGTATNGVDYDAIANLVTIPAGVTSNTITITPINAGQTDLRTVTLQLTQPPFLPPINYIIGFPNQATVFIRPEGMTNIPPEVAIATPLDGAKFIAPANIPICAEARDFDGYVATVEFFADSTSLGITTNNPMSAGPRNPFCLLWSNVPAGDYVLTAKATDNAGDSTVSAPVSISVLSPPPPTNYPPLVRITSPPNGAIFRAPINLPIYAYAFDRDGMVTNVEFFADTNSLGTGRSLGLNTGPLPMPPVGLGNIFFLVWSNATVGAHALTAVAGSSDGGSATSAPVNISILSPPPPRTNRPPIVSIAAIDPVAIEGTNCWPWLGLAGVAPTWSNWTGPTAVCRFFTNCGPKDATFAVRRLGSTNGDLTVSYEIGGTATNGVDYVPLPDSVTIPAGERRALITVVPLDDGPPDINSTVVLKLTASTNYVLGFPRRAAAIIFDSQGPRPVTGLLPDRCFHLATAGPDGAWFHVDFSTNLLDWTSICTNQVVNGMIDFIDPDAQGEPARFYRAVPDSGPPAE